MNIAVTLCGGFFMLTDKIILFYTVRMLNREVLV
ncbi:hypothetical protein VPH159E362A_0043 [Vibrio phage 159E36-2a]